MKRIGIALLSAAVLAASATSAQAFSTDNHTGSYIYAMGGFMNLDNDRNIRTGLNFGSAISPAFGLTYGHNITDWIAPEIQFSYSTSTGNTASGSSREHALTVRLNAKYSFLTNWEQNKKDWKFYPYAKIGPAFHALYVNAPSVDDKVGSYGYGFDLGGGLEVNYGVLYLGLDITNDFIFQQDYSRDIAGVRTQLIDGGFDYQISLMGCVGVHF